MDNNELESSLGKWIRVHTTFIKYGLHRARGFAKVADNRTTALLRHVTGKDGKVLLDHAWLPNARALIEAAVQAGDRIALNVQVMEKLTGYKGHDPKNHTNAEWKLGYELTKPRNIKLLFNNERRVSYVQETKRGREGKNRRSVSIRTER